MLLTTPLPHLRKKTNPSEREMSPGRSWQPERRAPERTDCRWKPALKIVFQSNRGAPAQPNYRSPRHTRPVHDFRLAKHDRYPVCQAASRITILQLSYHRQFTGVTSQNIFGGSPLCFKNVAIAGLAPELLLKQIIFVDFLKAVQHNQLTRFAVNREE